MHSGWVQKLFFFFKFFIFTAKEGKIGKIWYNRIADISTEISKILFLAYRSLERSHMKGGSFNFIRSEGLLEFLELLL